MNNQNIENENQKVLVFTAKEIEKFELDTDDDWKDLISSRIKTEEYTELYSGWDEKNQYYIVVVKV